MKNKYISILFIILLITGSMTLAYQLGVLIALDYMQAGILAVVIRFAIGIPLFVGIIWWINKKLYNLTKDKDKVIFELWRILDDIQEAENIANYNNHLYRELVHNLHIKRFKHISRKEVEQLYERYRADKDENKVTFKIILKILKKKIQRIRRGW